MSVSTSIRDFSREKSGIRATSEHGQIQANPSRMVNAIEEIEAGTLSEEELDRPIWPSEHPESEESDRR